MRANDTIRKMCVLLISAVWTVLMAQSVESLMGGGMELMRNGAYSQAVAQFRKVLGQDPGQFEAQHNIAFCYLQMGRHADAVREFKRAIEMNGRNAETWANLAFAYEQMGKVDLATDALLKSVNLDPSNVTARMNLAAMYVNHDRLSQAITQYKQIVSTDRNNVEAYINLAKCLINAKQHVDAAKYLREAIAVEPASAEAHWELGNIYLDKDKDYSKAAAEYQIAVNLQADDIRFHKGLADAQEQAGKKPEAIETLKKALVYVNDALEREKIQRRLDVLEGRSVTGAKASTTGTAAPVVDDSKMDDLRKDMRDDERKTTRVVDTKTLDISGDFDDLKDDGSKEIDLTKEAKKRAKQ